MFMYKQLTSFLSEESTGFTHEQLTRFLNEDSSVYVRTITSVQYTDTVWSSCQISAAGSVASNWVAHINVTPKLHENGS